MTTRSFDDIEASVVADRASKRMKSVLDNTDFVLTISPVDPLASLIYTLSELLQEVTLEVVKTSSFQGIRCDMTDGSIVAMIKARFAALVKLPEGVERVKFTVATGDLKTIFKSARGQTMDILRMSGSDSLSISCYGTPHQEFHLRTLNSDNDADKLNNIETEYSLKMGTDEFKNFCRSCSNFGSDNLTIEIRSDAEPSPDHTVTTYTSLICQTDSNKYMSTYKQHTKVNESGEVQFFCDANMDCDIVPSEVEQSKTIYSASFPVDFLQRFLKNSDKGQLWIHLVMMEDREAGPLILHVGLGSESSYMRLVLAPKLPEEED